MNKSKIICTLALAFIAGASWADDMYLTCKMHPAELPNPAPDQFVEVTIKMSTDTQMVLDPLFKMPVPFTTSPDFYSWKLRLRDVKIEYPDLTLMATLNRYTGAYKMFFRGEKGDVVHSLGTCKKNEKSF